MIRIAALAAAFALSLAACDDGATTGKQPRGPFGVEVGLIYTLSGEGGEFAQAALGAATLASEDDQARGLDIQIAEGEYGGSAKRARAAAERLADEGVAGIVVASDDPEVVDALAGFDRVPLVHALAPEQEAVTSDGPQFRVAPSGVLQARKLASFLVGHRGYDRFAVLYENSEFGREGLDDLTSALSREGGEVMVDWGFKFQGDVSTPITHAGQEEVDAMIVWTRDPGEAGRIAVEIHRLAQSYQLVLSGNLASFEFGKNASAQVVTTAFREGILSVGTWAGPWFELDRMRGFFRRFHETNNVFAPLQAAQVYDGVLVIAEASRKVRSSEADAVAGALEELEEFEGAGVPISFDSSHEGIEMDDMAVLAFTKEAGSAGGDLAPDLSTGGGFFTLDTVSVELPDRLAWLIQGGTK